MSKGCIQIQVGNKKYQFKDVDTSSTSLKDILTKLVRDDNYSSIIDQILETQNKDINEIIQNDDITDTYTEIGDFAIGNANPLVMAQLGKINPSMGPIKEISNLFKSFTDNSFLFADTNKNTAYIGSKRDFIVLNPNAKGPSISRALAFSYASSQLSNVNTSIYNTAIDYVTRILNSNSSLRDEFTGMSDLNAAKKLLILSQTSNDPICKEFLQTIGKIIKSETTGDQKDGITVVGTNYLKDSVGRISKYGNTITVINGNSYTNSNIIGLLSRISKYESKSELDKDLSENIPEQFNKYYVDHKNSKDVQLLNDLLFSSDINIANLFVSNLRKTVNNIIDYLYKPLELSDDESVDYYIPKVDDVKVDDSFSVSERLVEINDRNTIFNTNYRNKASLVELVLDPTLTKYCEVESGTSVKLRINPAYPISATDIDNIRKAVVIKSGKNAGTSKKNNWMVLKQKAISNSDASASLSQLFKALNVNNKVISQVFSTAVDNFSMEVAQAGNMAGIRTTIFPGYYPINKSRGQILSYIEDKLKLSFTESTIADNYSIEDWLNLSGESDVAIVSDKLNNKQRGDIITLKNTINQNAVKKTISRVYDFKFKPVSSRIGDMYDDGFEVGTVFSMLLKDGTRTTGTVVKRTEDDYTLLLDNHETVTVSSNVLDTGTQNIPLYLSDVRYINGSTYIQSAKGLIKDGRVTISPNDKLAFYQKELDEISNYSKQNPEEILDSINRGKKVYILSKAGKDNLLNTVEVPIPNYSNVNMVEIISNTLNRSGIRTTLLTSDQIANMYGESLAENKAFISGNSIIVNTDKYSQDSAIHELMHLLMAQYKITNPDGYAEMLNSVPSLSQFEELKDRYKELAPNDYTEEVLVHAMTDHFMGRVQQYGYLNIQPDFNIKKLASSLLKADFNLNKSDEADFLNSLLRTLLLEGNSQLLDNLSLGVNLDESITLRKLTNIKSDLIENDNLKIECK